MLNDEYIIVETKIINRKYGTVAEHKLKNIHLSTAENDLTPEFKDSLYEDYSIDIDELLKEYGDREDISKLLMVESNHKGEWCDKINRTCQEGYCSMCIQGE